jgi:hypothetical protein
VVLGIIVRVSQAVIAGAGDDEYWIRLIGDELM